MADNGNADKVTPAMQRYIEALIAGHNHTVAAKVAGVAKRTSDRWLTLPHFQQAYKAAQRQVYDSALNTLCLGFEASLEALRRHIQATDITPTAASQIAASKLWIEQYIELGKLSEVERKLQELEELIGKGKIA